MPSSRFVSNLLRWYSAQARDLPWRHTRDPYKIWISEIMLQQTTVNAVIPYYQRWIKQFPTVMSVARAPLQKILKAWQGLGYYSRARNIHKSARIILKEYGGKIPSDRVRLRKLPGFGPYTTGAVLSIAFDQREPIIDANVRRVFMRQLMLRGHADASQDERIKEVLQEIMPLKGNNIFNQALMELGALICLNRAPLCMSCPGRGSCRAFKHGVQENIPAVKKKVVRSLDVAVAVIRDEGRYFIQQRSSEGLLAGLWEFPGGKLEKGETPKEALYREIKEELGVNVKSAKHLFNVLHFYTEFKVTLHVFDCVLKDYPAADKGRKWVRPGDFKRYPLPAGSVKILQKLLS